jgi:hypothetical protein
MLSAQIALAAAQHVDMQTKVDASIKYAPYAEYNVDQHLLITELEKRVSRRLIRCQHPLLLKFAGWREIVSDNLTLESCVCAVHNDVVAIWNIHDLDEVRPSLLSRMCSL